MKWLQMATSTTKLTHSILLTRLTRFALVSLKMRLGSLGAAGNLRLKRDLHVKFVPLVRDPAPERAAVQTARRGSTVEHKQTCASRVRLEQCLERAQVSVCRAAWQANILELAHQPARPVLLELSRSPERAAARTAQPERTAELKRGPALIVQQEISAGERQHLAPPATSPTAWSARPPATQSAPTAVRAPRRT